MSHEHVLPSDMGYSYGPPGPAEDNLPDDFYDKFDECVDNMAEGLKSRALSA